MYVARDDVDDDDDDAVECEVDMLMSRSIGISDVGWMKRWRG